MAIEIERKFLVAEDWTMPAEARGVVLRQAYLTHPSAGIEVRVRVSGRSCVMTIKTMMASSGTHAVIREEIEFPVPEKAFDQLWALPGIDRLSKERWQVTLDNREVSVDVYLGPLAPLRVVEAEFASVEEAKAFQPPPWFGREITGDKRWGNRALARR